MEALVEDGEGRDSKGEKEKLQNWWVLSCQSTPCEMSFSCCLGLYWAPVPTKHAWSTRPIWTGLNASLFKDPAINTVQIGVPVKLLQPRVAHLLSPLNIR